MPERLQIVGEERLDAVEVELVEGVAELKQFRRCVHRITMAGLRAVRSPLKRVAIPQHAAKNTASGCDSLW